MKRQFSQLIAVLMIVLSGYQLDAQLFNYTDAPDGTPALIDPNATATNLTRYKCDTATGCSTGFMSDHFSKNDSFKVSRSSIDITITPNPDYGLSINSISVDLRRNPKGPKLLRFAYSPDGGASWLTNGTDISIDSSDACDIMSNFSWDFDDATTTGSVIFRIILFSAHGTMGKLQLKNLVVNGSAIVLDNDGDGYSFDVDCNDDDPAIHPDATEICNGVDDNCNGFIDEGLLTTYYADADGDGFGNPDVSTEACSVPDGYVEDNNDCNDENPAIYPAAPEVCNGVDDNCNGSIDEGIDLSIEIFPSGVIELCKPDSVTLNATPGFDSYQWYKNGSPLAGETGSSYTTNKPAYYQVEGFSGECTSGLSAVQAVAVYESPNANIFYPDGLDLCFSNPLQLKASYDPAYTFQWFYNGNPLNDSTNYTIFTSVSGNYYCMITLGSCTRNTSEVTVFNSCRLGENETLLNIYPNPVNQEFTIDLASSEISNAEATIQVTDIAGRIVYSNSAAIANGTMHETIQLNDGMPAGIYFVTVIVGQTKWNERIVVIK